MVCPDKKKGPWTYTYYKHRCIHTHMQTQKQANLKDNNEDGNKDDALLQW